jgi:hypothetical protein
MGAATGDLTGWEGAGTGAIAGAACGTGLATNGAGAGVTGGGATGTGAGATGAAVGATAAVAATGAGALATAPPKSSAIDSAGPTSMTLEHTEHRARIPVAGTFAGSTRNTVRQLPQVTFTILLLHDWTSS